eukprot:scaffold631_cov378-Prasinococcus_capsulatus_cf.AAC.28
MGLSATGVHSTATALVGNCVRLSVNRSWPDRERRGLELLLTLQPCNRASALALAVFVPPRGDPVSSAKLLFGKASQEQEDKGSLKDQGQSDAALQNGVAVRREDGQELGAQQQTRQRALLALTFLDHPNVCLACRPLSASALARAWSTSKAMATCASHRCVGNSWLLELSRACPWERAQGEAAHGWRRIESPPSDMHMRVTSGPLPA